MKVSVSRRKSKRIAAKFLHSKIVKLRCSENIMFYSVFVRFLRYGRSVGEWSFMTGVLTK